MWKINVYSYRTKLTLVFIFGGLLSLFFYNRSPINLYYPSNHYAGFYGEMFYFVLLIYRINIFKRFRSLTLIRLHKEEYGIQHFHQCMLNLMIHFIVLYVPILIVGWSTVTSYTMLMVFFLVLFIQYFLVELIALLIIYKNTHTMWIFTILLVNMLIHYVVIPLIFF